MRTTGTATAHARSTSAWGTRPAWSSRAEHQEEDHLRGEQHAKGGQEAPPARHDRHPQREQQARLIRGKEGERALGVARRGQIHQRARGQ